MYKSMMIGALAIAAFAATPAAAAGSGSTAISGSLATSCSLTAPAAKNDVSMIVTSQQTVGDVTYKCNFAGNAGFKFHSNNGGAMVMPAAPANGNVAQSIIYSTALDSDILGQLTNTAPAANSTSRSLVAVNTGQAASLKISLASIASVAGTYSDVIHMSINP